VIVDGYELNGTPKPDRAVNGATACAAASVGCNTGPGAKRSPCRFENGAAAELTSENLLEALGLRVVEDHESKQ
jgi:hypothetical protein